MIKIYFERQKLFNQIWTRQFETVANYYKISWKQLDEVCKKLNIPEPDQRQRYKITFRQKVERPVLPNHELDQFELVLDRLHPDDIPNHLPSEYQPLVVSKYLVAPHPIIVRTKEHIESKAKEKWTSSDKYNRLSPWGSVFADILATKKMLPRAFRIYDCLLKEMERQGYSIQTEMHNKVSKLSVEIDGIPIYLRVQEEGKQNRKKISNNRWPEYEYNYQTTGKLKLVISDSVHWGSLKTISDTKTKTLEKQLDKFYPMVFELVEREKEINEEREVEHLKRKAIREENERIQKANELELARRSEFEEYAKKFTTSQFLYHFIEEIKAQQQKLKLSDDDNLKFDNWIIWAKEHADRFNPIKTQIESILESEI
ncbi:MAG: hypothetical protein RLN90_01635 [Balneolaceae bacterium]